MSTMTKEKYFELKDRVISLLRKRGLKWTRTFTDKRKRTGYRTKLWLVHNCDVEIEVALGEIEEEFGKEIEIEVYGNNKFGHNMILRPKADK